MMEPLITSKNIDLSVDLNGLKLANPTILASGLLGLDIQIMGRAADSGAGAVTIKSLTLEPKNGHNNPILVEVESGFLNAVGYANKGIDAGVKEFNQWKQNTPLIGSVVGKDADEFAILTEKIIQTPIAALELPLSCPHTPGLGLMAGQGTPEATEKITRAVRGKTNLPIIVKLSPSVPGIGEVAKAAEAAGANIINMGNTLGPGMKIDLERGKPILAFKFGGVSGPAIKPVMIRCVYDIYEAVKIPIIATGGITTGEDALEAIMAGATAIGVGTAIYYRGMEVFGLIAEEMKHWLYKHHYQSLNQIKGVAHGY